MNNNLSPWRILEKEKMKKLFESLLGISGMLRKIFFKFEM